MRTEPRRRSLFGNWQYFRRRYRVNDFHTVINGRSVTNKITVGDEFEGGRGRLVFDRFESYTGTHYRAGDPYADELAAMVADTLATSTSDSPKFDHFRGQLTSDIEEAHWDLYWRLLCVWEAALDDAETRQRLDRVRAAAHTRADHTERRWIPAAEPIDVSAVPDQTIFPGPAAKTAELHSGLNFAMVWWTSSPSGAFQIVQRPRSGWVNWGTNGENECPELPVGVDIKTAYGPFADTWRDVADQLESPPPYTYVTSRRTRCETSAVSSADKAGYAGQRQPDLRGVDDRTSEIVHTRVRHDDATVARTRRAAATRLRRSGSTAPEPMITAAGAYL
jgi:hypothetical protein